MSFSVAQIRKLQRDVRACDVRTREVNGRELSYIEGWHAIAEANRIFGFDGWNRETLESRCVLARENRGTFNTIYMAKVRITVRSDKHMVVRDGYGTGEAHGASAGEAHDKAIKTAETDATKRALATFGKPFGLALYVGSKQRIPKPDIARRRTLQKLGPNGRYYVPPRPRPNPSDATAMLAQTHPQRAPAPGDEPKADISPKRSLKQLSSSATVERPAVDPAGPTGSSVPTNELEQGGAGRQELTGAGLSGLLIEHPRRRRDASHLKFVAEQPCLICSRTPSDPHHLRFAQPQAMAKKVSDEYTVPLCRTHHRQLHQTGNESELVDRPGRRSAADRPAIVGRIARQIG